MIWMYLIFKANGLASKGLYLGGSTGTAGGESLFEKDRNY